MINAAVLHFFNEVLGNPFPRRRLFFNHRIMLKHLLFSTLLFCVFGTLKAQVPPVDIQWSQFQSTGYTGTVPKILIEDGNTYWLLKDTMSGTSAGYGHVWKYASNGLGLNGIYPEDGTIGCSNMTLGPVDHYVSNGSIWGICNRAYISDPFVTSFCVTGPFNALWTGDASPEGLNNRVYSIIGSANRIFVCADNALSISQTDGRVIAFNPDLSVLWDVALPSPAYGPVRKMALLGDSIGVVAFPDLYWLQQTTGAQTSSTSLYSGPQGTGDLHVDGTDLYWAASTGSGVRYGKLDLNGSSVWSGTAPDITVNAITVDDLGRLWIAGRDASEGKLIKVGANGSVIGTYSHAVDITDISFSDGRLSWTGRTTNADNSTFLINTIPDP